MAVRYAGLVQQLIATSMVVIKKGDPTDKLTYFRLRTKHNEIIVIPGKLLVKLVVCWDLRVGPQGLKGTAMPFKAGICPGCKLQL